MSDLIEFLKTRFQQPNEKDVAFFEQICGSEHVFTDDVSREKYGRDETEDLLFSPTVIVRPSSAEEIQAIIHHANKRRLPIFPRAGGTGLSGGCLPVLGGVVVSVERMNRIYAISSARMMAYVEPGVNTATFQSTVEKMGLFYPPDPASRHSCLLGGNVAENAGGPRALKYGVTRDYVYGLDMILGSGERMRTGGFVYKNVAGYDFTHSFVGSEGTLAIFTGLILKLIPKPPVDTTLVAFFNDPFQALKAVPKVFEGRIMPSAFEFMDDVTLEMLRPNESGIQTPAHIQSCLLLRFDGMNDQQVENDLLRAGEILDRAGALEIQVAQIKTQSDALWRWRASAGEIVKSYAPYKEEDAVVPRDNLPDLLDRVKQFADRYNLLTACYGHVGDGNLHINILKVNVSDTFWKNELPEVLKELFQEIVKLGGSITGEHGIGWVQRKYLPLYLSRKYLELMWNMKMWCDPGYILNPGKVFPDSFWFHKMKSNA